MEKCYNITLRMSTNAARGLSGATGGMASTVIADSSYSPPSAKCSDRGQGGQVFGDIVDTFDSESRRLSEIMPVQNVDNHAGCTTISCSRSCTEFVEAPPTPRPLPAIRRRPRASADGGRGAHDSAISPQVFCARYSFISRPLSNEGAGNAGRPMRPIAACAMVVVERTRVSQVTPESPGIPHAMVLTVTARSPRCSGLFGHRRLRSFSQT
jgi:hypothetical protein